METFGGPVHVEWDPDAAVTPLGHLAFFAEYLKVSGRFDALVADCPLHYTSPNAPSKRDVLGRCCCRFWRASRARAYPF